MNKERDNGRKFPIFLKIIIGIVSLAAVVIVCGCITGYIANTNEADVYGRWLIEEPENSL